MPPRPGPSPSTGSMFQGIDTRIAVPVGAEAAETDHARRLHIIRQDLGDCVRCPLSQGRINIVFGQGNPDARLAFIGEAPGEDEDKSGLAFVGRAGQLLTRMIGAMGLTREAVFIGNVNKCRPPGNRAPEPPEIAACRPFVERQLEAIRPQIIVTLGATATRGLLRTGEPISSLRGRWHRWNGIDVMPTFHPAYLLRSPDQKGKAWDDLKLVMGRLGLELPPPNRPSGDDGR